MATRKTKASKRSGTAKGGRGVAKKSKPSTGRKKARPAAKAGRKSTAKAKRPAKKVAARKAPAKRKTAKPPKAAKPARPAKTAKTAGRKAAKKAPRPATRKAPAPKAERKRVAVKKAAAPPKAVQPKPAAKKAATKPAPAVAPRTPPVPAPQAVPETAVAVVEPAQAKAEAAEAKPGLPAIRPYRGTQGGRPAKTKARPKKRARNRYSKLFAEFETRPAPPERKKKRRSMDEEEEETSISVLRERPKLQIESPEQIRAGVIKKYLETGQPSCPVGCGGIAEVVRVGTLEDGSGEVWIECLSCAQRERFQVPRATPAERQAAQQAMEDAGEAMCPRHGRPVQLRRRGRDLVCPECGVLYPET